MTISNGNMLSTLLTSTDAPGEGLTTGQLQMQTADTEGSSNFDAEGQFWSMLNHQLTEIVSTEDAQVIDNKDLLAMFEAFEHELENKDQHKGVPAEWMQFMKSHFEVKIDGTENRNQVPLEEITKIDPGFVIKASSNLDEFTELVVDSTQAVNDLKGEPLPVMRQAVSAEMPGHTVINDIGLSKIQSKVEGINMNTVLPAALITSDQKPEEDLDSIHKFIEADHNLKNGDDILQVKEDKSAQKHVHSEQQVPFAKSDGITVNQKTSEVITNLQVSPALGPQTLTAAQSLSSQNIPTALQNLQMHPQAPVTEWGNAIGERVSFLINQKLNHAEIRIDPPHLGKLEIQIQVKEDTAVIMINTQHTQTRDLIDAASLRLREFLQEAGYNSVDVNVSHREQSMAQQQNQEGHESTLDSDHSVIADADEDIAVRDAAQLTVDNGRIDYFA